MKFLHDPTAAVQRHAQAQLQASGVRVSTGETPTDHQHGPGLNSGMALSGMADALQRAQDEATRMGLKDPGSIGRAQQWLRDNHLHFHIDDTRLLIPLARLLDRLAEVEATR